MTWSHLPITQQVRLRAIRRILVTVLPVPHNHLYKHIPVQNLFCFIDCDLMVPAPVQSVSMLIAEWRSYCQFQYHVNGNTVDFDRFFRVQTWLMIGILVAGIHADRIDFRYSWCPGDYTVRLTVVQARFGPCTSNTYYKYVKIVGNPTASYSYT